MCDTQIENRITQRISFVDDVILEIGENDGWASLLKLYRSAPECLLWFMIGARRIGKTDLMLQLSILLWVRHRRKTMWIRDVLETMKSSAFQADFLNDAYEFGWIHDIDDKHRWSVKDDGVHEPETGEVVIKFQSLSTYSSRRGPGHPDVDLILFDEFIPEDRRYQKGALKGLMSLTKTVFSGRQGCRCICTSNYVSLSNPYFAGLEIYPDPEKDVTVWPEKMVAVERCRGYRCAIADDSGWNRLYKAAGYGDYADEDEDMMHKLIRKMPKGAKGDDWAVNIGGQWFRIYTAPKGIRIAKREKEQNLFKQKLVFYVTDPKDLSDDVVMIDAFHRVMIDNDIASGRLRYEDPNTLFAFINLTYNI